MSEHNEATQRAARITLRDAVSAFFSARDKAFRDRDTAIRRAALQLSQQEICDVTGFSPETIRKITQGWPVSWNRARGGHRG